MKKVRFNNQYLIDENGTPVISEEELMRRCMENVSYSYKTIEIIKYTLKNLGYQFVDDKKYRESSLFNKIENSILQSDMYQGYKNVAKPRKGPDSYERYLCESMRIQKERIALYAARRPHRFGKRG